MSFRPEAFNQFCKDKLFILDQFIRGQGHAPILAHLHRSASCGIYCWAAEMTYNLEGVSTQFLEFLEEAAKLDSDSRRVLDCCKLVPPEQCPKWFCTIKSLPDQSAMRVVMPLNVHDGKSYLHWRTESLSTDHIEYRASERPWGYAFTLELAEPRRLLKVHGRCFLMLIINVLSGKIGIGLLDNDHLKKEQFLSPKAGAKVFISLDNVGPHAALMIRNGDVGHSHFRIVEATIVEEVQEATTGHDTVFGCASDQDPPASL
jgi:hypothetical protein